MANKTIGQLTERTSPVLTDQFEIETAENEPRRLSFTRLFALFFGSRVIGGTGTDDITTNNGNQNLNNKKLTLPGVNSDTDLEATSEEIDAAVDLANSYLGNVTSDVQDQLDNKADASVLGNYPRKLGIAFTTGGAETTKQYTEAALLALMSLSSLYISYAMTWSLCIKDGSDWDGVAAPAVTITPQTNPGTGQGHLSSFNLSGLTASTDYLLTLVMSVVSIQTSGT